MFGAYRTSHHLHLYTAKNPTLGVLYGKCIYTFLHSLHLYTAKNLRLSSLAFTRYLAKSLHTLTSLARKVFFCIAFVAWRFGDLEIWRGADFVAQQRSLPCAIIDAALRNKGVGGCARRLMGCRKLQGKKCAPLGREVRTFQERSAYYIIQL